jgi:DNA-binding NarL/FixJ family response regulator
MDKIQLLIIDEHQAVRDALQVRLETASNLEVIAAYRSASEWRVRQDEADVVLLGLKSGGRRPLTTIIHDIEKFNQAGTAVIILASLADDVEKEIILQAGARRYLLKDINSKQLIAEIKALVPFPTH